MGQGVGGVSEAPAVGETGSREPIGRFLAQQRKLRGIELDDLAAATRIPRRSLERLEAGAFDHSPDGFSRGFVRTVAEAIGIDADDAVARMLPEPGAETHRGPRWGRVAGALGALAALVLAALFAAERALAPVPAADGRELPRRHDYVRELAEASGQGAHELSARDAVIAFRPAPPPELAVETATASETAPVIAPTQPAASPAPAAALLTTRAPVASTPSAASAPPAPAPRAETAPISEPAALAPPQDSQPAMESAEAEAPESDAAPPDAPTSDAAPSTEAAAPAPAPDAEARD
jgi:transcriptional regulator with XRE-family HTH domain